MKEFELNKYTIRAEKLLKETKQTFQDLNISINELPETMQPDEGAIKLVFVGQYSAGKSSIIKMLSDIDTGIGAGITTQKSKVYDWNDLQIIDTPGIHTGLRPDHDEITYNEIGQAALLIFVITNEGFDRQIGDHFRKLAIEQKRGNNMILVINKMDRTAEGNTPEQQQVIRDDICKSVAPYTPEDLYLSFLSTQSYDEYLEETDPEIKAELLEESGHDTFIDNLNTFVSKKQISARLQQPLYKLETVLQKAMGISTDEDAIDGAEEVLKRILRILDNEQKDCMKSIKNIIRNNQRNISIEGRNAAECLKIGAEKEEIKTALESSSQKVSDIVQDMKQQVNDCFSDMLQNIETGVVDVMSSDFAKNIAYRLKQLQFPSAETATMKNINSDMVIIPNTTLETMKRTQSDEVITVNKAIEIAKNLGDTILEHSGSKLSDIIKKDGMGIGSLNPSLASLSGSDIHKAVKSIGNFVGIKFAPWEALKWTKGLTTLGSILSIGGLIYQAYDKIRSFEKEQEMKRKILQAQEELKNQFNDWANQVNDELLQSVNEQMANLIEPKITETKQALQSFQDRRDLLKLRKEKLDDIFAKEQKLMQDIEQNIA